MSLFTAGWYVVTKGKILSLAFFFCVKADDLAAKLTPERDLSMTVLGKLRVLRCCTNFTRLSSNVVFEELFLSSLIASPLMEPFLTPGEWHELKGFSRFVVSFDVQNGIVFESLSFEHHCVEESNLVL